MIEFILAPVRPPQNLEVQNTSWSTIQATWLPPPKEFWNGPLRGFKLMYYKTTLGTAYNKTLDVKWSDGETVSSGGRRRRYINDDINMKYHLNIIFLQAYTNYSVVVKAYNSFDGPFTSPVTVVTSEDGKFIYCLFISGDGVSRCELPMGVIACIVILMYGINLNDESTIVIEL